MRYKRNILLTIFTGLFSVLGYSQPHISEGNKKEISFYERYIKPDFIRLQFAGGIGMFSGGVGKILPKSGVESSLTYGFTQGGEFSKPLHTLSHHIGWTGISLGDNGFSLKMAYEIGVSVVFNAGESFIRLPARYPEGYYSPNAFRFHASAGIRGTKKEFHSKHLGNISGFIMLHTDDQKIYHLFKDFNTGIRQVANVAFGCVIGLK